MIRKDEVFFQVLEGDPAAAKPVTPVVPPTAK
jgi:hypothetical protein